ncbi:hypothetical protein QQ045_023860 [Rhodiola kirilowii]
MKGGSEGHGGQVEILSRRFKGLEVVTVRKEVKEEALKENKWALATGKSFNITALASSLKKAWIMETGVRFEEIGGNMAVARFEKQEDMEYVLDGGPWWFGNQGIVMKRWEMGKRPELLDLSKIEIWIQIHNLPLEIMRDEIASGFATMMVGRICKKVKEHSDVLKRKFMRYKVEVDINLPLKDGVLFALEVGVDEPIWISFKFERLPVFCEYCGVLSHESSRCNSGRKGKMEKAFGDWFRAESAQISPSAAKVQLVEESGEQYNMEEIGYDGSGD